MRDKFELIINNNLTQFVVTEPRKNVCKNGIVHRLSSSVWVLAHAVLNRFIEFHLHCCRPGAPFAPALDRSQERHSKAASPYSSLEGCQNGHLNLASFGKSFFFNDIWETSHTLHLYTGAPGSIGFGAVFGCHWLDDIWPEMWKTFNIAFLELSPIVLAVHVWGSLMANNRIIFFSDNASVVDFVNKQTSRHKDIMVLLRDLVLSCLRHNILFQARHIPGLQDSSADYLSQVVNFKDIFLEAEESPTQIPENLMPKNWVLP